MSGVPKAAMGLTLLIMRLLVFVSLVIGTILGTLTTFRFVVPHIKVTDTDAGYIWRSFGKRP